MTETSQSKCSSCWSQSIAWGKVWRTAEVLYLGAAANRADREHSRGEQNALSCVAVPLCAGDGGSRGGPGCLLLVARLAPGQRQHSHHGFAGSRCERGDHTGGTLRLHWSTGESQGESLHEGDRSRREDGDPRSDRQSQPFRAVQPASGL